MNGSGERLVVAGTEPLCTCAYLIATQPFGPVHGLISFLHKFAAVVAVKGIGSDANTNRHIDAALNMGEGQWMSGHGCTNALSNLASFFRVRLRQEDQELFSPIAARCISAT